MPAENTIVSFLYRDAGNYKRAFDICIPGMITKDQIDRIAASLDDGEYFIPERVGLAAKRWDNFDPQLDHKWCTLRSSGFSSTAVPAGIGVTPEDLACRFEALKGRWEDMAVTFDWELPMPEELRGDGLQAGPHEEKPKAGSKAYVNPIPAVDVGKAFEMRLAMHFDEPIHVGTAKRQLAEYILQQSPETLAGWIHCLEIKAMYPKDLTAEQRKKFGLFQYSKPKEGFQDG